MDNDNNTKTALAFRRSPAPAIFLGYQEVHASGLRQPLELWNLIEDIPGHPKGSTVSRRTLEMAGFAVLLPPQEELPQLSRISYPNVS